jgi:dihydroorotate dehydrogenase (NAD+) catalytic subunit
VIGGLSTTAQPADLRVMIQSSNQHPADLSVTIGSGRKGDPLTVSSPILAAAGTIGTGAEVGWDAIPSRLGALVTPTIAHRTRRGGMASRLVEAVGGLLVVGQYPTLSVRSVQTRHAPFWQRRSIPVIANVSAESPDQCLDVIAALSGLDGIRAVEIALPASSSRGSTDPSEARLLRTLCDSASAIWHGPILVKLPIATDAAAMLADSAGEGGADAAVLGGGFPGSVLQHDLPLPARRHVDGMLVGPATKSLALQAVARLATESSLPVIASGGVATGVDALDFLIAGACAVQVGSASLRDPMATARIIDELEASLRSAGLQSLTDLRNRTRREAGDDVVG